jgi:hypothetical protein
MKNHFNQPWVERKDSKKHELLQNSFLKCFVKELKKWGIFLMVVIATTVYMLLLSPQIYLKDPNYSVGIAAGITSGVIVTVMTLMASHLWSKK